jgi:hypothetical protein
VWPERYEPGTTDNYVSNEIIVAGLTTADVWPFLNNTSGWPTYYEGSGPELRQGARFRFSTFSFPVEARSRSMSARPIASRPAVLGTAGWKVRRRRGWTFTMRGCLRTCPVAECESLPRRDADRKARSGVGPDETQPMLNAHQEWIEGLARVAALRAKSWSTCLLGIDQLANPHLQIKRPPRGRAR